MESAPEVGSFRVLLVDSGSASCAEVGDLLAACRYQVRHLESSNTWLGRV